MLGCIQPMSSPMMKRMLGFAPCCWADAGRLAIVVAVHSTTRAAQIDLNMRMVASLMPAAESPAAAFAELHQPTFADPRRGMFRAIGRTPRAGEIDRSALRALCS